MRVAEETVVFLNHVGASHLSLQKVLGSQGKLPLGDILTFKMQGSLTNRSRFESFCPVPVRKSGIPMANIANQLAPVHGPF